MTLHSSKGLEFPVVFIPGCINGNIPFIKKEKLTDFEEERRLFYVGITRAKEMLYLLHTRKNEKYGKIINVYPSPFLKDLEDKLKKEKKIDIKKKIFKEDPQLRFF